MLVNYVRDCVIKKREDGKHILGEKFISSNVEKIDMIDMNDKEDIQSINEIDEYEKVNKKSAIKIWNIGKSQTPVETL